MSIWLHPKEQVSLYTLRCIWMTGSPYLEHSSCDILFTVVTSDTKLCMIVHFAVWNTIPREEQQAIQRLLYVGLQVYWEIIQLKFVNASTLHRVFMDFPTSQILVFINFEKNWIVNELFWPFGVYHDPTFLHCHWIQPSPLPLSQHSVSETLTPFVLIAFRYSLTSSTCFPLFRKNSYFYILFFPSLLII